MKASLANAARKALDKNVVGSFRSILGDNGVLDHDIEGFTRDWQHQYGGPGSLVLFPKTTKQVSECLKLCNAEGIAIVPQGGNTSLVAGATPIDKEIVLSLIRMNQIERFDPNSGVVTAESGVVLQTLQEFLHDKGHGTPWDLGARGSCTVGGNISTMAAGIHFVKYGSMRNYILGLEVVTPDGTILDLQSEIRKDNSGTDLKQLFIGSEGTLGIVTRANILTVRRDTGIKMVFVRVKGYDSVLNLQRKAKLAFGSNLRAIEYVDLPSYKIVEKAQATKLSLPYKSKECDDDHYFMIIEICGDNEESAEESLVNFCAENYQEASEALLAKNYSESRNFWQIRERVAESCSASGYVLKYDISLDITKNEELLTYIRKLLGSKAELISGYAHIGDGNLHVNIVMNSEEGWHKEKHDFEPEFMKWVIQHGGSISAEHGIGWCKSEFLPLQKPAPVMDKMHQLKKLFDPNGILNPGKVLEL